MESRRCVQGQGVESRGGEMEDSGGDSKGDVTLPHRWWRNCTFEASKLAGIVISTLLLNELFHLSSHAIHTIIFSRILHKYPLKIRWTGSECPNKLTDVWISWFILVENMELSKTWKTTLKEKCKFLSQWITWMNTVFNSCTDDLHTFSYTEQVSLPLLPVLYHHHLYVSLLRLSGFLSSLTYIHLYHPFSPPPAHRWQERRLALVPAAVGGLSQCY